MVRKCFILSLQVSKRSWFIGVKTLARQSKLCTIYFYVIHILLNNVYLLAGAWSSVVFKALRHKSEGPGIDSKRWRLEFILWQLTSPCALGSTQPLKMSTRIFLGGKGGRCVRVTTLQSSYAECLEIWSLNRPEPSGPHRPVIGAALPFISLNENSCNCSQNYWGAVTDELSYEIRRCIGHSQNYKPR